MATAHEVAAMRRAVALSALGLGSASPNPPVGCVVLDVAGNVVGEGFHRRKGEAHAEVNALAAAGTQARGGTAVVTLEPCNHHGRTPPCRQGLIEAGIARVVIALIDPTSREEGGAARLRAAGVDVELGVGADEVRQVIGPWLSTLGSGLPHVHWLGAAEDVNPAIDLGAEAAALRPEVDAVLTSEGTFEEGVPGAHSPDVFSLPTTLGTDPRGVLADLSRRGVRTILLSGPSNLASALADDGLVDRISWYMARQPASNRPAREAERPPYAAAGFELRGVTLIGDYVRLNLNKVAADQLAVVPE